MVTDRDPAPARRVVLLGASNLTRGLSTVVETARLLWSEPLDVLVAAGHGRSYGTSSRVLARTLPAILDCGLWHDLTQRPRLPTVGLLTDIGNDILYEAPVERIAAWVEQCLTRLAAVCERIAVTQLPLARLQRTNAWQYGLLRTLLFPDSRLAWPDARERAQQLNARVVDLAARFRADLVTPLVAWYGWDPIHIRGRQEAAAWRTILSAWRDGLSRELARGSCARWWQLHRQRPLERHWFGRRQLRAQPACVLTDGTTMSWY
jgi:hypothetical protein